uniref:hypothetical protein n=1 Tax=Flavobacterium sp. TaxID=239 RepID=UPI004047A0A4
MSSYAVVTPTRSTNYKRSASAVVRVSRSLPKRRRSATTRGVSRGITGRRTYQFTRSISTNNGASFAAANQVLINCDGNYGFIVGGIQQNSFNMSIAFQLNGMALYFGGVFYGLLAMPNVAEFQNLFDQYRIDKVDLTMFYSVNTNEVDKTATTSQNIDALPVFGSALDYDDTASVDMNGLQQYASFKQWQWGGQQNRGGVHRLSVKPAIQRVTFSGNAGTATAGSERAFGAVLDTSTGAINHFGVKMAFDPITQGVPSGASKLLGTLVITAKYHMTFYNTR